MPVSVPWPHPEALGTPSRWRLRPPVQGERLARAPLHGSPREARPPAQRLNVRRHGVPVRKSRVKTRIATCPASRTAVSATGQADSQLRHRIGSGLPCKPLVVASVAPGQGRLETLAPDDRVPLALLRRIGGVDDRAE